MGEFDVNDFDSEVSEFDERSGQELYDEFLSTLEKSKGEFVYYYGRYYNVMRSLSSAAKDLLTWMVFNSDVNTGRVSIQSFAQRNLLKELGITVSTYYKALSQLKGQGIIKGGNAVYCVNPAFAWKGTAEARSRFMRVYPRL